MAAVTYKFPGKLLVGTEHVGTAAHWLHDCTEDQTCLVDLMHDVIIAEEIRIRQIPVRPDVYH